MDSRPNLRCEGGMYTRTQTEKAEAKMSVCVYHEKILASELGLRVIGDVEDLKVHFCWLSVMMIEPESDCLPCDSIKTAFDVVKP